MNVGINKIFFFLVLLVLVTSFTASQNEVDRLAKKVVDSEYYILPNDKENFLSYEKFPINETNIVVGAERIEGYLYFLKNKKVAVFSNVSSVVRTNNEKLYIHIIDTLLRKGVNIVKILAPEHGIKGIEDAGKSVENELDSFTNIPIISLYPPKKNEDLEKIFEDVDVLIFDIQDVGARFYTYISSLHLLLENSIHHKITFIVLDRPNPNGFYVDGPLLKDKFKSFIGMHNVPIVHGMTVGEYAQMIYIENMININGGEKFKNKKSHFSLIIIPCINYTHKMKYKLPIKPSPNLLSMQSIYLYPSLCLFEGTIVSVGRGTNKPFSMYGLPNYKNKDFSFTPISQKGSRKPCYLNKKCYGKDLSDYKFNTQDSSYLNLEWIVDAIKKCNKKNVFFKKNMFLKLSGNDLLIKQLLENKTPKEIKQTWQHDLDIFKKMRKKYLLYEDF